MKRLISTLAILFVTLSSAYAQLFQERTVNIGNIGINITNAGTLGRPNVRNDPQGNPSMEYPIGSGVEHLFEGGIWLGVKYNGQTLVSTASIDDASGYATGKSGFEFTPLSGTVTQRSTLTSSPFFSRNAVSHQDYSFLFTDSFAVVPGTTQPISGHQPIKALVKLDTYAWNFSFADYFTILNYTITNGSDIRWDSIYVGTWSDLVVRNVNVSNDRGAAFFNKGSVGFVDSLYGIYAYDINGDVGYTNSYGCIQFLGAEWRGLYFHPANKQTFINNALPIPQVYPNYWQYNSPQTPTNDLQRYAKMGTVSNFADPNLQFPGNRVQLLNVGPFVSLNPGESFTLTMAMLSARQLPDPNNPNIKDTEFARQELKEHLGWAKTTYLGEDQNENGVLDPGEDLNGNNKLDRFILPEPPAVPKTKIITESEKVTVYWDRSAEASIDPISKQKDFEGYKLYKTKIGDDLKTNFTQLAKIVGQWDKPGNSIGFNNGFNAVLLNSPKYFEDDTTAYWYSYTFDGVNNGWQFLYILTSFDSGDPTLGLDPLESSFTQNSYRVTSGTDANNDNKKTVGVYPNPYRTGAAWDGTTSRNKKINFYNLPSKAEIRIYTVSGDIVATLNHDATKAFNGSNAAWFNTYSNADNSIMAEGEHSWDILSDEKQLIASGVYLFSVKNLLNGEIQTGKFTIIR